MDHRVDFDRHVVARDHVLAGHVENDGAQIDAHDVLNERNDDHELRPLHAREALESDDHGALAQAIIPRTRSAISAWATMSASTKDMTVLLTVETAPKLAGRVT